MADRIRSGGRILLRSSGERFADDRADCSGFRAWLLSAMPDPDLQQMSQNRKRVSLKPYSKLAAAPWVAGNIAFLKDFDYLECRLKSTAGKALQQGRRSGEGRRSQERWWQEEEGREPSHLRQQGHSRERYRSVSRDVQGAAGTTNAPAFSPKLSTAVMESRGACAAKVFDG